MSLLLSIETTKHTFSCALHEDGELVSEVEVAETQSTASKLAPTIESLFPKSDFNKAQLSAVVVSAGPGSYTGLRIGTATAKGICFALNIPLVSINSLLIMAKHVTGLGLSFTSIDLLCPMLDARRMEVYCMVLNGKLEIQQETKAIVLNENSFNEFLRDRKVYFFGDGSEKFKTMIRNPNAIFIDDIKPSAAILGRLGYRKFQCCDFEDTTSYEPFYLKDFVIKKPNLVS
jgi:tRNA threonylcarbamoyladenosine biosynthesis protein TsaB